MMYDKIQKRIHEIWERLDNLEGCEDNPIYKAEIAELRKELAELHMELKTEFF